jgi:hypothetical protein
MDDGFGRKAAIRSSTKPRGLARQGWSRIFRALAQRILAHPCTTPNFGIELAKYSSGRGQQAGPARPPTCRGRDEICLSPPSSPLASAVYDAARRSAPVHVLRERHRLVQQVVPHVPVTTEDRIGARVRIVEVHVLVPEQLELPAVQQACSF